MKVEEKPDPIKDKFDAVKEIGKWNPIITNEAYLEVLKMCTAHGQHSEIAGLFIWDEETNTIGHFKEAKIDSNTGGGVQSDTTMCRAMYIAEGLATPNGQWHTHPRMTGFWSITDLNDQMVYLLVGHGKDMKGVVNALPNGKAAFIVMGENNWGLDWVCRLWEWKDHELVGYMEGAPVFEDGTPWETKARPTFKPIHGVGHEHLGDDWDDELLFGGYSSWYGDSPYGILTRPATKNIEVVDGELVEVDDIPPQYSTLAKYLDASNMDELNRWIRCLDDDGQELLMNLLDQPAYWDAIFEGYWKTPSYKEVAHGKL